MKHSTRSTAALGAIAALCIAAPAAFAERPAVSSDHPAQPVHPEHPVHPETPGQANDHPTGTHMEAPEAAVAPVGDADGSGATTATTTNNPCGNPAARSVFAPWQDRMTYVLVQNGGFEQGDAGWTLAGDAAVIEGNEQFFLNDTADHQSLSLPAGSSATSPATCFGAQSPTFRFVARTSGDRHSRLEVEVLYTNQNGRKVSRKAGAIRGDDSWQPSKRLAIAIGRGKGHGRLVSSSIAFRFTPIGAGDWQVDDLFLDPRARH